MDLIDEGMDACDLSWDVYTALLKINETMTKRNDKDVMKSAAADAVPSHERLVAMAECSKWFTLHEYCEFYCDPIYVELESEKEKGFLLMIERVAAGRMDGMT